MTIRKLIVLAAVVFLLTAVLGAMGWEWFGLESYDVRRHVFARGFVGLALFALSTYPAGRYTDWLDRPFGGWSR